MTQNSWVTKEDIEENVPEVLATYKNTFANAEKYCDKGENGLSSATEC